MRTYKVLSIQIPQFWEAIKFAVVKVDEVEPERVQDYLIELLHSLLNDKAQFFAVLDDNKVLSAVCITRILIDKVTGEKYLFIQNLYSFTVVDNGSWNHGLDVILDFAKRNSCKYLTCMSRNHRIFDIVGRYGFRETERIFKYSIVEE